MWMHALFRGVFPPPSPQCHNDGVHMAGFVTTISRRNANEIKLDVKDKDHSLYSIVFTLNVTMTLSWMRP